MTPESFTFLSALVKKEAGINLTEDKAYLLDNRLATIMRQRDLENLEDLCRFLKATPDKKLIDEIVDALTTNESLFFRDGRPFEAFRQTVLPHVMERRAKTKTFRIWCAAASSGQEPYSLAMLLKELEARLAGWTYEIIGTDISTEMIEKAKAGQYSQFEVPLL